MVSYLLTLYAVVYHDLSFGFLCAQQVLCFRYFQDYPKDSIYVRFQVRLTCSLLSVHSSIVQTGRCLQYCKRILIQLLWNR